MVKIFWLVVGIPTPLKNNGVKVSWDFMTFPTEWKVIKFHTFTMYFHILTIYLWLTKIKFYGSSHHQPDSIYFENFPSTRPCPVRELPMILPFSQGDFHRFPMEFPRELSVVSYHFPMSSRVSHGYNVRPPRWLSWCKSAPVTSSLFKRTINQKSKYRMGPAVVMFLRWFINHEIIPMN